MILRAYERWGEGCVERLRGMFAFAIWDPRKNSLFVARDRFGIKPFYFAEQNGSFYFASEIKALSRFFPLYERTFQHCTTISRFSSASGEDDVRRRASVAAGALLALWSRQSAAVSSLLGSPVQLGLAPYGKILRRPNARPIGDSVASTCAVTSKSAPMSAAELIRV